ncbi:hypothetical protein SprV_0401535900 [Sparganum proliferum]
MELSQWHSQRPQHHLGKGHTKEHGFFAATSENFGRIISTERTIVMHQPTPNSVPHNAPQISVKGTQLQVVDNFVYLGSTLSCSTKIDDEVARRISKASQAFGRLYNIIRNRHDLHINTKLKVCKAALLSTLLYNAVTWMVYKKQAGRLNHFHLTCLPRMLKLRWQDRIPDTNVQEWTGFLGISVLLRHLQLRRSGQLVRMDNERQPKRLFYGDVVTCSRRQGGQIHRYMDTLKTSLKRLQINPANCEDLARDRPTWRRIVKTGGAIYEANRITLRKPNEKHANLSCAQPSPTCSLCQRTFRAPSGLVGHLRTNCNTRTAPIVISSSTSPSSFMPPTNTDRPPDPPLPSSSSSSSSSSSTTTTASTFAVVASAMHINITLNSDTPANTNTTTVDTTGEDLVYTCPHCDSTFISHIRLVGHWRIYRTETGEPVSGAPTYTRRIHLHCTHCPRKFMHRMDLFGHMRIHESEIDRNLNTPNASSTPTMPSLALTPPPCAPTATNSTTPSAFPTLTKLGPTRNPSPSAPTTTCSTTIITVADTDTADF